FTGSRVSSVNSVAITPRGEVLAAGCANGALQLWDPATGKELPRLQASTPRVDDQLASVAFSPDGKLIAAAGRIEEIRVWDVRTGKLLQRLGQGEAEYGDLSFSADGKTLLCTADRAVRVWDVATWREVVPLGGPYRAVTAVAFTPDGKQL